MIDALVDRLERFYGPLPQPPADPFALYVWEVLGVHTTAVRRDAAMNAVRRIPALTPDALTRAPRAKLEAAVALAGPHRDERLRALTAGADAFRRQRHLPSALRGDLDAATEALDLLPHLTTVSRQWMLLFAGGHLLIPDDRELVRVLDRLAITVQTAANEIGEVLSAGQRAALYLAHHGRATCLEADPLCRVCPLRRECPYPDGAGS